MIKQKTYKHFTTLIKPLSFSSFSFSKRFMFNSAKGLNKLPIWASKRMLNLFDKKLTNNYSFNQYHEDITKIYRLTENRPTFFKHIRNIANNNLNSKNPEIYTILHKIEQGLIPRGIIVSGLKTFSKQDPELVLLSGDDTLAIELQKHMVKLIIKVYYNIMNPKFDSIEECLLSGFENLFGHAKCLNMSKQLNAIIGNKNISLIQHFVVTMFGQKTFNYDLLEKCTIEHSDCSSYKGHEIRALTFAEATYAKKFIEFLTKNNVKGVKHHLINSESLPPFFETTKSMDRTDQKHCDSVFFKGTQSYYYDFKSYCGLTVSRCRIALFHSNQLLCNKLLNELMTTLSKHIKDNKLIEDHPIKELYGRIILAHKKGGADRYKKILDILAKALFEPPYEALKISFTIDAGEDHAFDKFYDEYLKDKIENNKKKIDFSPLFPSDCRVQKDHSDLIKEIVKDHLPIEFSQQCEKILWK